MIAIYKILVIFFIYESQYDKIFKIFNFKMKFNSKILEFQNYKNNNFIFKYNNKLPFKSIWNNEKYAIIDLKHNNFYQIWGKINFKNRNQNNSFKLNFDTNFSYLWLPSKKCINCPNYLKKFEYNLNECKNINSFKEIKINNNLEYIKGKIVSCDIIFIDKINNLKIKDFKFIWVNEMNINDKNYFDGVFGMSIKDNLNDFNFIEKLYENNIINKPFISFLFSKYDNYFGQMIVGDLNQLAINFKEIEWKNINNKEKWSINFDKIYLKDKIENKIEYDKNVNFIIDSGINILILPLNIYDQIKNRLSINFDCKEGKEEILTCNDSNYEDINLVYPDLVFYINNVKFTLNPIDYIFFCKFEQKIKLRKCYFKILKNSDLDWENESDAIIGLPFFKKFYIIFDYKKNKIGFTNNYLHDYIIKDNTKTRNLSILFVYIFLVILFLIVYYIKKKYFFKDQTKYTQLNK